MTDNPHRIDDLFKRYMDICNQAIEINKNKFPYQEILGNISDHALKVPVAVSVIDDTPETSFVVNVKKDGISVKPHKPCQSCQCGNQWRVTKSYLEKVVQDPETYINNPAKIDWDWIMKE